MTDSDSDPLDPIDEMASAALDGGDTRGEHDPRLDTADEQQLADRVARLAQVRDQIAAPVAPPSDDVRDRMIARAVSVGHASADVGAPSTAPTAAAAAPVTSLDAHRSRRTARFRRFAPIAAAAAILLLVAIITPTFLDSGDDDLASTVAETSTGADGAGDEVADTAPDEPTESDAAQALAPEDADSPAAVMEEGVAGAESANDLEGSAVLIVPSPPSSETESGDAESFDELGAQVSDEELLDAVIQYRATQSANSLRSTADDLTCADRVDHPIDLVATGTYRMQPAVFLAQLDGSAVLAVTVVDPACEVLAMVASG